MSEILVTGGAGFIGHNLALALEEKGAQVHVLDSLQVNNLGAFANRRTPNPNADLYMSFITERLDMLRARGCVVLQLCVSYWSAPQTAQASHVACSPFPHALLSYSLASHVLPAAPQAAQTRACVLLQLSMIVDDTTNVHAIG